MATIKGKTFAKHDKVMKELEKMQKAPKKVVEMTMKEFQKRAPSWVAQEVTSVYNIKKAEVTPTKKNNYKPKAGSIKAEGKTLDSLALIYRGRTLTPVHFGMTPKAPREAYTLKAEIKKGDKKTLGQVKKLTKKQRKNIGKNLSKQGTQNSNKSPIMLMHTGNKKEGGTNYIPFQRQSKNRKDIKAVKTLSMPQMVSNAEVEKNIYSAISDKLGKRFEHYVDRYYK